MYPPILRVVLYQFIAIRFSSPHPTSLTLLDVETWTRF